MIPAWLSKAGAWLAKFLGPAAAVAAFVWLLERLGVQLGEQKTIAAQAQARAKATEQIAAKDAEATKLAEDLKAAIRAKGEAERAKPLTGDDALELLRRVDEGDPKP